jgi:hypothetical protein
MFVFVLAQIEVESLLIFFLVFLEQKERPTEAHFWSIEKQKKNQKLGTNSWIGFKL